MDLRPVRAQSEDERGPTRWQVLKSSWPLTWRDAGLLLLAFLVISAVWVGIGRLITGPLDGSVGRADDRIARQLAHHRTAVLNDWSLVGSYLAETITKIVVTAVVVVVLLWRLQRWREPLFIALSLILEASCFLAITLVVSRDRPHVHPLDTSPVDSSFPSGHVAAAVVYGAFAVIVFMHTRSVLWRSLAVVLTVGIPAAVGWARMYRGMHHLSDVIAGALLGLVSLVVTWWILERAHDRSLDREIARELGRGPGSR